MSVLAVGIALAWLAYGSRQSAARRQAQAASVASRLAGSPALRADLAAGDGAALGALLDGARRATGARFAMVVVPARTRVETVASGRVPALPYPVRAGTWVAADDGPLPGSGLQLVGVAIPGRRGDVFVGVAAAWRPFPLPFDVGSIVDAAGIALGVGLAGSLLLSRWLRRRTLGLELDELTNLLQEQKATLHGIREGVMGLDSEGRLRFVNDEAQRLLGLPHRCLHRPVTVMVPKGRLREVLSGRIAGEDLMVVHGDRVLVVNRMPVNVEGRPLGFVVTLVDRTESESLLRELDGTLGLTEALRAQAHDFSNRIHTLVGLVELGHYQEAVRFGTELQISDSGLVQQLSTGMGHPVLSALLLAKSAVARERRVELRIGESTAVEGEVANPSDLVTVVGNLVDNAIDAAQWREPAWVEVTLRSDGAALRIDVADSGPGVDPDHVGRLFVDGFTTKVSDTGSRRGLGLAVLQQLVHRRGGQVTVGADPRSGGALFSVVLPAAVDPGVVRPAAAAVAT